MTKKEMLFMMNMREKLPDVFSIKERETYLRIVDKCYERVKDKMPFEPMTKVSIIDDIDGEGGKGQFANLIGHYAVIKGNYMFLHGGTGYGTEPWPGHEKVMDGNEMHAKDGYIPNAFSSIFKYSIIVDYESQFDRGGEYAWWPHECLEKITQKEDNKNDKEVTNGQ